MFEKIRQRELAKCRSKINKLANGSAVTQDIILYAVKKQKNLIDYIGAAIVAPSIILILLSTRYSLPIIVYLMIFGGILGLIINLIIKTEYEKETDNYAWIEETLLKEYGLIDVVVTSKMNKDLDIMLGRLKKISSKGEQITKNDIDAVIRRLKLTSAGMAMMLYFVVFVGLVTKLIFKWQNAILENFGLGMILVIRCFPFANYSKRQYQWFEEVLSLEFGISYEKPIANADENRQRDLETVLKRLKKYRKVAKPVTQKQIDYEINYVAMEHRFPMWVFWLLSPAWLFVVINCGVSEYLKMHVIKIETWIFILITIDFLVTQMKELSGTRRLKKQDIDWLKEKCKEEYHVK